jgi:hypothetical protein
VAAPLVGPGSSTLLRPQPASLADVLERVLDKGIVIAGDIRVDLVGVELLTIRLRLLVASVDRAREMGIDWWEHDPMLSSRAAPLERGDGAAPAEQEGAATPLERGDGAAPAGQEGAAAPAGRRPRASRDGDGG